MQRYTYEPSFPSFDVQGFCWDVRDTGERIFAPKPHRLVFALGWSGVLAGIFWFALAYFIPGLQTPMKMLIFIGGCFFCTAGWLVGWILDSLRRKSQPLIILKPDCNIELPRLNQTVVPNDATHFELVRHISDAKTRNKNIGYDLILWHDNQTYKIFHAAQPSWKFLISGPAILTVDHLRDMKKLTPVEKLYMELSERQSGNLKTVAKVQKAESQKYRTQMRQEAKRESWSLQLVPLIIGTAFTLAGGYLTFDCINQSRLGIQSVHWPHVEGTVLESYLTRDNTKIKAGFFAAHHSRSHTPTYRANVVYRYQVDDRKYTGNRVSFGGAKSSSGPKMRRLVENYPPGKIVQVYYRPGNPAMSTLEQGNRISALFIAESSVFLIVGVVVLVIFFVIRRQRRMGLREET